MREIIGGILMLAICMGASPGEARGDEVSTTVPTHMAHVLGGHNYLPSLYIPAPFVDTETNFLMAAGFGTYPSGVTLPGNVGQNLKLVAFEPLLNVQYAVVPWLALNLGFSANVVSGLNSASMLIYGASVAKQFAAGLVGKIFETPKMILSLGLQAQFPSYMAVTPLENLSGLNRSVGGAVPDFVTTNVTSVWRPTLRYAYTFDPTFGLMAEIGARVLAGDLSQTGQSTATVNTGLSGSADLNPKLGVPLGFTANYFRKQIIESNDTNANFFSFGLYETRWTQASFGVEIGFGDVVGQSSTLASLTARIYY